MASATPLRESESADPKQIITASTEGDPQSSKSSTSTLQRHRPMATIPQHREPQVYDDIRINPRDSKANITIYTHNNSTSSVSTCDGIDRRSKAHVHPQHVDVLNGGSRITGFQDEDAKLVELYDKDFISWLAILRLLGPIFLVHLVEQCKLAANQPQLARALLERPRSTHDVAGFPVGDHEVSVALEVCLGARLVTQNELVVEHHVLARPLGELRVGEAMPHLRGVGRLRHKSIPIPV
mmetsp:Transcript_66753/g.217300  ORF Transcript_66753/g.217300 Transcript_66753/m.217300 type:complete len:239 (-) Transcript_66753:3329-4045(-)